MMLSPTARTARGTDIGEINGKKVVIISVRF
jgi:hypothetical protein